MRNLKSLVVGFVAIVALSGCATQPILSQSAPTKELVSVVQESIAPKEKEVAKDIAGIASPLVWWEGYGRIKIIPVSDGFGVKAGKPHTLVAEFAVQCDGLLNIKGLPLGFERLGEEVPNPFTNLVLEINGVESDAYLSFTEERKLLRFNKDVIAKDFRVKVFVDTSDVPTGTRYSAMLFKGEVAAAATPEQVSVFWKNTPLAAQWVTLQ